MSQSQATKQRFDLGIVRDQHDSSVVDSPPLLYLLPEVVARREDRLFASPPLPTRLSISFVPEDLAARALYLDAPGSLLYCRSLHNDLKHSVLEAGVDLALICALRQRHAPAERTVAALPYMVASTLLFLLDLVLT
jgi:hypothetical protein